MPKKKPGRPPKEDSEKFRTPIRILGRVDDETWERIKKNYAAAGDITFTAWAVAKLLKPERKAKRKP